MNKTDIQRMAQSLNFRHRVCGDKNVYCYENCKNCAGRDARLAFEAERNSRRVSKGMQPHPDEAAFKKQCGLS